MSKSYSLISLIKECVALCLAVHALFGLASANTLKPLLLAQSAATISGTISEQTGATVKGAVVRVRNQDIGIERASATDSEGRYEIAFLASGSYTVTVTRAGFQSLSRENITLTVGQEVTINFELSPAAVSEQITISGSSQVVERASPSVSTLIGDNLLKELPLNGRNLLSLTLLGPGTALFTNKANATINDVGLQISIVGVNKRSNLFLLDGTPTNNAIGLAGGATETLAGIEAIKEFRIHSSTYDAQYGRAAGGIITMVSRGGANSFHGSVFEFHRNDSLDARNFFDNERKPDFNRHQFGWSLGGPIIKNKTYFMATSEHLRERLGAVQRTVVPDQLARAGEADVAESVRPYLSLFPLPNGQALGGGLAEFSFPFNRIANSNFAQVRIDHVPGDTLSLFGRYTIEDSRLVKPLDYPQFSLVLPYRSQFITLEATRVISPNLVGSTRFGYARTKVDQFYTDTVSPGLRLTELASQFGRISIGGLPVFGGTQPSRILFIRNEFDLSQDLAYVRGRHTLKFGGVFSRFQDNEFVPAFRDGLYIFADLASFLKGRPVALISNTPGFTADGALRNSYVGLYIQDEFRVRPGLSFSFGLRYDPATVVKDRYGRQSVLDTLDPLTATTTVPYSEVADTPYKNPSLKNFAPRVGMAWSPFKNAKTSLRAGFGIFYDALLSLWVTRTALANPPFNTILTIPRPEFPRQPLTATPGLINAAVSDFNVQQPRVLKWNLGVEHEVVRGVSASLGYVGTRGLNLIRNGDVNSPATRTTQGGRLAFVGPRRNPNFNNIDVVRGDGDSYYHALQLNVQGRAGRQLQFYSAYTFSRSIDDTQGLSSNEETGQVPQAWLFENKRLDRGLSSFHRKHVFTLGFVHDLPFNLLAGTRAKWLTKGWQLNGILSINSGLPFTVGIQTNRSNSSFGSTPVAGIDRPDWMPGRDSGNAVIGGPDRYFDPGAFALPPRSVVGNVGRNTLIGPDLRTFDVGLKKRLPVPAAGETGALEIRLDAFNVFNRANFGLPDRIVFAGAGDGETPIRSAGRIRNTSTSSRQLQIGLRMVF